jgi:hypothetical protein
MPFQKGHKLSPKVGHRKERVAKLTAKEAIQNCFYDLGGLKTFSKWARKNQTEFYRLFAKTMPVDTKVSQQSTVTIVDDLSEKKEDKRGRPANVIPLGEVSGQPS